jgi:O-antigen ligase
MTSIAVSLSHPIVGVGIGQFAVYEAATAASQGLHSSWQGTHNTYTQVSSEAGIPALIVFVCVIIFSLQGCRALSRRARKFQTSREMKEILDMTFALTATLIVYSVCICFDYIAYSPTLLMLGGFVIGMMRCGTAEIDRWERPPVSEQPDAILNLQPVRGARAARPAVLQPASSAARF